MPFAESQIAKPRPRVEHPVARRRIVGVVPFLHRRRDLLGRRVFRRTVRKALRLAVLISADVLAVALSAVASFGYWGTTLTPSFLEWRTFPVIAFLAIVSLAAFGAYREERGWRNASSAGSAALLAGIGLALVGMSDPRVEMNAQFALGLTAFLMVTLVAFRLVLKVIVGFAYSKGLGLHRAVLIGHPDDMIDILESFASEAGGPDHLVGFVAPDDTTPIQGALGTVHDLGDVIEKHDIRHVVVSAHLPEQTFQEMAYHCFTHGTALSVVPAMLNELPCKVSSRHIFGWPMLELQVPRLHLAQMIVKRWVDVLGALVGIALLAPVFLLIAAAIKMQSPGPVLFRQRRPGLGGALFGMLKFRTMRVDAEDVLRRDPVMYARFIANDCKLPENEDPRIFPVGAFLRKTSLDELPQLFNVLMGDMSLVGPRPVVGPELAHYGDDERMFLGVRPGMTGYWQVTGRSNVLFPDRAHMDVDYILNWSFLSDLKILLQTPLAVLRKKGAH